MKWACKNTLVISHYEINIENLLSPVYHLILELHRSPDEKRQFHEWVGEIFNITEMKEQIKVLENVTEESFLVALSRYIEDFLYEQRSHLEKTEILLLYRSQSILIAPAKTCKEALVSWIRKSGIIDRFLDLINNANINSLKNTLTNFLNKQYFGSSVKVTESSLKGTFVPKNFVVNYKEQPIDEESIWICGEWKNKIGVQEDTQYNEVFVDGIDEICLSIGDWILPTGYIDDAVISEASTEFFWAMLNNVYAQKVNKRSIYRDRCKDFAEALKDAEFANLMTSLQYNLYLPKSSTVIPDKYISFFEEVYHIEQFKEEANQILFTGNHVTEQVKNGQTMFGLYRTVKDDTEFNLRAWINVETNKSQRLTTSKGEENIEIKTVYALKPHYSYYFCKDYFEDMFADMLRESGIIDISNFELYKSDASDRCFIEIDKMVKKEDGTLVYIETKTTLNRYNIEDTLNEVANFHQIMSESYPNVQIKYLLVSLYHNETVEDGFSYFTNIENSSIKDFKIPIARYNGVELHCIVEPEYEKLKGIMERLLK